MSRLRNLEQRRKSLGEIREIMNSMKSLAYLEARKLHRLADAGRKLRVSIECAAADVLHFHPEALPSRAPTGAVLIALGTERGFCGDLNQQIWHAAREIGGTIVAVGTRLQTVAETDAALGPEVVWVSGANVVEEIPTVMQTLVDTLESLRSQPNALGVSSLSFDSDGSLARRELLPSLRALETPTPLPRHAPVTNLPARELLLELGSQHFYACLHDVVCASLLNEQQRRMTHLDAAVDHLDTKARELSHTANALRQEEITEEIEVILLAATPRA